VYDVWSEERECRCVAKLPRPERVGDPKTEGMLLCEGALLQRLCHPHIVRCYDVLRTPAPVVILETLTGATLAHLVDCVPRIALGDLAMLGLHLCSAIGYLHRRAGVLHLDLKPSNVIAEHGRARIIDLSIARAPGAGHRGVGTRQCLAPEQARGDVVTEATDVWGIGGVLFHAATGRTPFDAVGRGRYEQLERRAHSIRRYRRLPSAFTAAVDACLEPDPRQRPSVSELARALCGHAEGAWPPDGQRP
jgi:serine/threonine protein kinase